MSFALILTALAPLIDKILPDPKAAAEAKVKLFELEQAGALKEFEGNVQLSLAQMAVNAEEAKSPGVFKGGWRPATGWMCVAGFAYTTVLRPLLPWVANLAGANVPPLPAIDTTEMMVILGGLLGLGGMRSAERMKGKA